MKAVLVMVVMVMVMRIILYWSPTTYNDPWTPHDSLVEVSVI